MPVVTVDTDDLVTIAQIAAELGRSPKTVRSWAVRYAAAEDDPFPAPLIRTEAVALYSRQEVLAWAPQS